MAHLEIIDLPMKSGDFPVRKLLVYQRVCGLFVLPIMMIHCGNCYQFMEDHSEKMGRRSDVLAEGRSELVG